MARLTIDKACKKKGVSKRQLAMRLEEKYSNIFRLFRAGYNPRFSRLQEIAKAIGCRVRDLFEE